MKAVVPESWMGRESYDRRERLRSWGVRAGLKAARHGEGVRSPKFDIEVDLRVDPRLRTGDRDGRVRAADRAAFRKEFFGDRRLIVQIRGRSQLSEQTPEPGRRRPSRLQPAGAVRFRGHRPAGRRPARERPPQPRRDGSAAQPAAATGPFRPARAPPPTSPPSARSSPAKTRRPARWRRCFPR